MTVGETNCLPALACSARRSLLPASGYREQYFKDMVLAKAVKHVNDDSKFGTGA